MNITELLIEGLGEDDTTTYHSLVMDVLGISCDVLLATYKLVLLYHLDHLIEAGYGLDRNTRVIYSEYAAGCGLSSNTVREAFCYLGSVGCVVRRIRHVGGTKGTFVTLSPVFIVSPSRFFAQFPRVRAMGWRGPHGQK